MVLATLISIVILLFCFYFTWRRRKLYILSWQLDGPIWFPIIGNAWYFRDSRAIMKNIGILGKRFKTPIRFWLGTKLFVYIDTPEYLQNILNAHECQDKTSAHVFIRQLLGDGLFNLTYEKWLKHRKLINPSFRHKVLLSFFPILNAETDTFAKKLNELIGRGDVCLNDIIVRYTLDMSCQTTMGVKLNFQNGDNPDILKAYQDAKYISGVRIFSPWIHPDFLFKFTQLYQLQIRSRAVLYNFISNLIKTKLLPNDNNSIREINSSVTSANVHCSEENIFINQAIKMMTDKNEFSWTDVLDESSVMVAASFDTTATTISHIIICLAMHPEYQEKVIEEVHTLFPMDNFEVTFEDTKNMTYCDMVINETLRLFPSLPLMAKRTRTDFQLNDAITIPKGVDIVVDLFSLHREEKYWGSDANKFNPERFANQLKDMHPYIYIPFSKGPRNCIGWRSALFSLKVFMAKTFKKYRFTSKQKLDDFEFRMDITLKSLVDLIVQVHPLR